LDLDFVADLVEALAELIDHDGEGVGLAEIGTDVVHADLAEEEKLEEGADLGGGGRAVDGSEDGLEFLGEAGEFAVGDWRDEVHDGEGVECALLVEGVGAPPEVEVPWLWLYLWFIRH
jgi:hypothetical protein